VVWRNLPADSSALDGDCDFAIFEVLALVDFLERGCRFCNPEIVCGVRVDADVGLVCLDLGDGSRHYCNDTTR